MRYWGILLLVLACSPLETNPPKTGSETKIIGGTRGTELEARYTVALTSYDPADGNNYLCTGAVIDSSFVLTAAHCVYGRRDIKLYLGIDMQIEGPAIDSIAYHRSYQSSGGEIDDIALVHLRQPLSNFFRPIPLANFSTPRLSENHRLKASGYGKGLARDSGELRYGDVRFLRYDQSQRIFITEFLAGQNTCAGDSGGPLVFAGRLHGINNWGRSDCLDDGGKLDVRYYQDWISCAKIITSGHVNADCLRDLRVILQK